MDWLLAQAQQAGPFVAFFCLTVSGGGVWVVRILWKQLLFERSEHRKAEEAFTVAAVRMATGMEKLAASLGPRRGRK